MINRGNQEEFYSTLKRCSLSFVLLLKQPYLVLPSAGRLSFYILIPVYAGFDWPAITAQYVRDYFAVADDYLPLRAYAIQQHTVLVKNLRSTGLNWDICSIFSWPQQ